MTTTAQYVETRLTHLVDHFVRHDSPNILVMVGPPGTGKTEAVRRAAAVHLDAPFVFYLPTLNGDPSDALGRYEMIDGNTVWMRGSIGEALSQEGTTLCIDDAHLIALHLSLFAGMGDGSRCVTVPSTGERIDVAEGVRLIILANPPALGCPPWERFRYEIPEPIRDRARVVSIDWGLLTRDDEIAIAQTTWPDDFPKSVLEDVVDVCRDLRAGMPTASYTPSLRSLVIIGSLLSQQIVLHEAFDQAVTSKYLRTDEQAAVRVAFRAKFGAASQDSSLLEDEQKEG